MDYQSPIEPVGGGKYRVHLAEHERTLLKELPAELVRQMTSGDDDGSLARLFPPGYSEDIGRQVEYDRLMRDDLQTSHTDALKTLETSADALELDEMQVDAWVRALNQLRLVLGTRLDVTEDTSEEDIDMGGPLAGAYALYGYLGHLQDAVVEAMMQGLDRSGD